MGRPCSHRGAGLRPTTPRPSIQSPLLFKLGPSLHGNLAAVKLSLILVATLLYPLLTRSLSCFTPAKVVKLPERVRGKDEIPNGQAEKIDKHPSYIRPPMSSDDNEHGWKTENEGEQDKRDNWSGSMRYGGLDGNGNYFS
jgi:hypothetical protein